MKFSVVGFVQRDAVASDVHEEIAAMGEAVVDLLQGMDNEVDRGVQGLVMESSRMSRSSALAQ